MKMTEEMQKEYDALTETVETNNSKESTSTGGFLSVSIEKDMKEKFAAWMSTKGMAISTVKNYISTLDSCGVYARKKGYIDCSVFCLKNISDLISLRNTLKPDSLFLESRFRGPLKKYIEFRQNTQEMISSLTQSAEREQILENQNTHMIIASDKVKQAKDSAKPISDVSDYQEYANEKQLIETMEEHVLQAELEGISFEKLRDELNITMSMTRKYAALSENIVEIKGKLFHTDGFVDWNDGAERLSEIIEKLMQKNNGYISAPQLYDYARIEMNMFLNDNNMNDERSVFDIAEHLFKKMCYKGKSYTFVGKTHISSTQEVIGSNYDLICKFAENQGGVFNYDDLVEYCNHMGMKTGNLRGVMQMTTSPEFLSYGENVLISAKSMEINDEWMEQVREALKRLFADVGDHIILREIQPFWYEQLPTLPGRRPWTPLLLQSILRFYKKSLGACTIAAMDSQGTETLHAMLVKIDSPIQNFGDVVISYLLDNEIAQRCFGVKELRQLLVDANMIQGSELIYNMPKALGHDERFAWDAKEENVVIRI